MRGRFLAGVMAAAAVAAPLSAQIATPARPVTDPRSLTSPVNPAARPVPVDDIATTRGLHGAAWSADGRQLFLVTNLTGRYNIWRMDAGGGWPVQITQSDDSQFGMVLAPGGRWLMYEQDQGGNEYADIFRVSPDGGAPENLTNTPERSETDLLPAPSGGRIALSTKLKSEGQSNIAVMNEAGEVRVLTREADPQYGWTPVAWIDGDRAIIANRRRVNGRVIEVWRIDAQSGAATPILAGENAVFDAADASADGRLIAMTTNQGRNQLRAGIYDTQAKSWRYAPETPWEQYAATFVDGDRALLLRTNVDARTELTRLDLATMKESALGIDPGVNSVLRQGAASPDGSKLLVQHSAADSPLNLYILDVKTGRATPATQLAMATLSPAVLPKSSIVTYKSFDGTLVSAVVTMPFNLKRDGSNPAIVLPHGGPTGQARDGFSQYATAFATRGYVVIQPNFRGSTGYGGAFQNANYKDLGGGDLKDTIAAKDFLVASGYVDAKRVGIFGGSYGGFMTLMAIGRAPDAFAAAVQWFGIINWRTMYRDQDERLKAYQRSLLGTPEENPDVYDAASPLTYIRQAKAPLLTIQGENDIRVPRGQAQEVNDILKAKGNVVETVYYPAEGHGFDKRENQLDSMRRTVAWFDRYLKPQAK